MWFKLAVVVIWPSLLWTPVLLVRDGPEVKDGPYCESSNVTDCEPGSYISDEARLFDTILRNYRPYKKLSRPVLNVSATIPVSFGISLIQILGFDVKQQVLTTLIWKKYQWTDELLRWNPRDYGGVDNVRLPPDKIWTPDIILYNNVGVRSAEHHRDLMLVFANGQVVWQPPVKYVSSCIVEMTVFPFDEQQCKLNFASWTYDLKKLDLFFIEEEEAQLNNYLDNSEWEITSNSAKRTIKKYTCCDEPWADLTFTLTLKRRVTFHMRLILVPTVLLSIMAVAVFWIPPDRPDRTGMGISLFSSFLLLLILIVNSSPATDDARLGEYYVAIILLVFAGIMVTVVCINIVHMKCRMPSLVEKVFVHVLAQILLVQPEVKANEKPHTGDTEEEMALKSENKPEINHIGKQTLTNGEKWKSVALVLDRLFFVVFFIALVSIFVFIFPRPSGLMTL